MGPSKGPDLPPRDGRMAGRRSIGNA